MPASARPIKQSDYIAHDRLTVATLMSAAASLPEDTDIEVVNVWLNGQPVLTINPKTLEIGGPYGVW